MMSSHIEPGSDATRSESGECGCRGGRKRLRELFSTSLVFWVWCFVFFSRSEPGLSRGSEGEEFARFLSVIKFASFLSTVAFVELHLTRPMLLELDRFCACAILMGMSRDQFFLILNGIVQKEAFFFDLSNLSVEFYLLTIRSDFHF